MPTRSFPAGLVNRVRNLKLVEVLNALCTYWSQDRTYEPKKNPDSKVFVVEINGKRYNNLLITGDRWFDLETKKGGGGAIDLVMYLKGIGFVQAVKLLTSLDKEEAEEDDIS